MKNVKDFLTYIWCLPQNLLGLLLRAIYKGYDSVYEDAIVRRSLKMKGAISLGRYIIMNQFCRLKTVKHEWGHCRQSMYLGPLYLVVIGISSGLHALLCKCINHSYNDFPVERWADKLGGVKR